MSAPGKGAHSREAPASPPTEAVPTGHSLSAELSAPPRTSWDEIKRTPSSRLLGPSGSAAGPTVLT